MKPIIDNKGRLVLPATRKELEAMTDEEVNAFRALHIQTGYGGLVQAADEELAERKRRIKQ